MSPLPAGMDKTTTHAQIGRSFKSNYLSYDSQDCNSSKVFLSPIKSPWIVVPEPYFPGDEDVPHRDMLLPMRNCKTTKSSALILASFDEGSPGGCSSPQNDVGLRLNRTRSEKSNGPHWLLLPHLNQSERIYGTRESYKYGCDDFGGVMAMGSPTLLAALDTCAAYAFEKTKDGWKRTVIAQAVGSNTCYQNRRANKVYSEIINAALAASKDFIVVGNPCQVYLAAASCAKVPIQVFRRSNWKSKPLQIPRPAGSSVNFAESIDMSDTVIAVGDSLAGSNFKGAVFVSRIINEKWSPFAAIPPPKGSGKKFGWNVRVSGTSIAVSAVSNITYIYELTNGAWKLQASVKSPLIDRDALQYDYLPTVSTDISGRTLVTSGQRFEMASIYRRSPNGTGWVPDGEIRPNATCDDAPDISPENCYYYIRSYRAVALANENTIVASRMADYRDDLPGLVDIYTRVAPKKWVKRASLGPEWPFLDDLYAKTVVTSGSAVVIGAPGCNDDRKRSSSERRFYIAPNYGAAYIFTNKV